MRFLAFILIVGSIILPPIAWYVNWVAPPKPLAPEVEVVGIQFLCPGVPGFVPRIVLDSNGDVWGPGYCWSGDAKRSAELP